MKHFSSRSNFSRSIFSRSIHALLAVLFLLSFLMSSLAMPAYAQDSLPPVKVVDLQMNDGWTASGRHMVAGDFVIVCPSKEVLDPSHPCSDVNGAQIQAARFNDFVLVCPSKEVLDTSHPCFDRNAQIIGSTVDDFVLVCPTNEVLDPNHPCSKKPSSGAPFEIPGNYVLTCPVKEVLEPQHPCASRAKSEGLLDVQKTLFLPNLVVSDSPIVPRSGGAASGPVDFTRVDEVVRGGMQLNAQAQCVNKVYTPVADTEGKLRMIGMSISGDNLASLSETGNDFTGGVVNEIEIARLKGCNYTVTAVRTEDNALKLISWFSSPDGFERMHDTGDGGMAATEVEIAAFNHPTNSDPGAAVIVTAARTSGGALDMKSWSHNPNSGFQLIDTDIDEQASEIAMTVIEAPAGAEGVYLGRVVTAFRTPSGDLKLISWGIDFFGGVTRLADSGNQAGAVQKIAIARYDTRRVVTAVKNSEGNLQLIAWRLNSEGELERLHGEEDPTFNDPFAGQVQEIAMTPFDFSYAGFDYVATAVRTEGGNLRLIAWGIDSSGNIKRHGDSDTQAGAASHIQAGWSQESNRLVTTMRDSEGNLRAIAWRVH